MSSKRIIFSLAFSWLYACFFSSALFLQAQPTPAPPQKEAVAIVGATIHIGNGKSIPNGVVVFDGGKILYVGNSMSVAETAKQIINATGKHVYPGFIALASNLGLAEIEQVKATLDYAELGNYNPNIRSLRSYNTDSKVIPTIRSNGVLMAQSTPQGGVIPGQSSVFQLDAWNWEDAVYAADEGIFLNWPNPSGLVRRGKPEPSNPYDQEVAALELYFQKAKAYHFEKSPAEKHLGYEAMRGLWNQNKTLYIQVNRAKAMVHAIQFAQKHNVRVVLVGAQDAVHLLDYLKEQNIPIILSQPHRLPNYTDESIDLPYALPVMLQKKGILFALSLNGFWEQRNLAFQAGQCLAFGLQYEEAVAAISLNAAKILGISNRCGSLETGKDATLFISDGDALDMKSHQLTHAYIQGRTIDLDNKQKELYRRYKEKYERMK